MKPQTNLLKLHATMEIYKLIFLVLLFSCLVTEGNMVRMNSYKEICPGKEASVYVTGRVVTTRNKIECVAVCQQDDSCTSVTYQDNTCSLFTSYNTPCTERATSVSQYLEVSSNNWCGHGGQMESNGTCSCTAKYRGQFCQIGRFILVTGDLEFTLNCLCEWLV